MCANVMRFLHTVYGCLGNQHTFCARVCILVLLYSPVFSTVRRECCESAPNTPQTLYIFSELGTSARAYCVQYKKSERQISQLSLKRACPPQSTCVCRQQLKEQRQPSRGQCCFGASPWAPKQAGCISLTIHCAPLLGISYQQLHRYASSHHSCHNTTL